MTRLVCWQPLLTDHQRHTLDALGIILGGAPEYIVAGLGHAVRDQQGWQRVDAAVTLLPPRGWLAWARGRMIDDDTVHIFGSPFGERRLIVVLIMALRRARHVWLVSEPFSPSDDGYFSTQATWRDRVKARLRPLMYRVYGWLLRGRVAGVFAISPLAVTQYRAMGVAAARVVPFGYFVPGAGVPPPRPATTPLRVVFVGALIARKGIAELIAAAALLTARKVPVTIDVFGAGSLADDLPANLRHRGMIAFTEAPQVIAGYDLLVVPSRHDGWAVVVNEALQAGVPVLASDRTGAGAMIDRWGCGARFAAGDPAALAEAIARLAADEPARAAMAAAARALAPALAPTVAAAYMAAAVRRRPQANPWY